MLTALALIALEDPAVTVRAPDVYVQGEPYVVTIELTEGKDALSLPAWTLSPAAFEVGGKALGERPSGSIAISGAKHLELELDLAPALKVSGDFELSNAQLGKPVKVRAFQRAPKDLKFLDLPAAELAKYRVLLATNRGPMLAELWPDVAPKTVASFLDLASTGFYDGILFHRIIPGFMIQGGDPNTKNSASDPRSWGSGAGPRRLDAEFNDKKHVRGVLSMARSNDPNSASSQFFVCHGDPSFLDHQYTAFGKLLSGFEALDRIANSAVVIQQGGNQRVSTDRPIEPQRIEHALVLLPLSGSK